MVSQGPCNPQMPLASYGPQDKSLQELPRRCHTQPFISRPKTLPFRPVWKGTSAHRRGMAHQSTVQGLFRPRTCHETFPFMFPRISHGIWHADAVQRRTQLRTQAYDERSACGTLAATALSLVKVEDFRRMRQNRPYSLHLPPRTFIIKGDTHPS